jgi:hypothetical protein
MNDTPEPTNAEIVEKAREYQKLSAQNTTLRTQLQEVHTALETNNNQLDILQNWFGSLTKDRGSVVVLVDGPALLIKAPLKGGYNEDKSWPELIQVIP